MTTKCEKCPKPSEIYARYLNMYECEIVCSKTGYHNHPLCNDCYKKAVEERKQEMEEAKKVLSK